MKAVVTGGAGFIGSHLVSLLLQEGHEVLVIDNLRSGKRSHLQGLACAFHEVDIRDQKALFSLFLGVDWIFHLAGIADVVPSFTHPDDYYDVNVTGTLKVLEAARRALVKKFVYAASSSCYGNPRELPTSEQCPLDLQSPYALTKQMGEQLVLSWEKIYQLPVISLRLFNVIGPRAPVTGPYSSLFGIFLQKSLKGEPLPIVGDGLQTRDFVYVQDVAKAFYQAALSPLTGEIFNVGGGRESQVLEIAQLFGGEKIFLPPRVGEPRQSCADISKIGKALSWQPEVTVAEAISLLRESDECKTLSKKNLGERI